MYGQQAPVQQRYTLDLGTLRSFTPLVLPGYAVQQVYVATLPSGADLQLRFGAGNPPVPMIQGSGVINTIPSTDGVYVDNSVQAGLTAVVVVTQGQIG